MRAGYAGFQIVPRFATYVYFNCRTTDVRTHVPPLFIFAVNLCVHPVFFFLRPPPLNPAASRIVYVVRMVGKIVSVSPLSEYFSASEVAGRGTVIDTGAVRFWPVVLVPFIFPVDFCTCRAPATRESERRCCCICSATSLIPRIERTGLLTLSARPCRDNNNDPLPFFAPSTSRLTTNVFAADRPRSALCSRTSTSGARRAAARTSTLAPSAASTPQRRTR